MKRRIPGGWLWGGFACLLVSWRVTVGLAAGHDAHTWRHTSLPDLDAEVEDEGPHYAPERDVDMLHLRLDVTPDFQRRTIAATAALRLAPLSRPVRQVRLDAVNLHVLAVRSDAELEDYTNTGRQLVLTFRGELPVGREVSVEIDYTAEPKRGFYFRTPDMGYPDGDTHAWTQGETHEARFWIPCFDYPNERSSTEVICHVPAEMTVLSNGRRISEELEANGLKRVHWLQEKPHVSYLICLVVGNFQKLEQSHRDIPLGFYTQPSLFPYAQDSFADTADIMAYFEEEIGVPFPWNKYDQVTILDFVAGGMENTTLTTLTADTLFAPETENIHNTRQLNAHEMAHQWFGDLVTCRDWSHLWLNEGFATYYTALYEGHKFGHDELLYSMYQDAQHSVLPQGQDKRPIVYRMYKHAGEQFDYRAYPKGGWVLHMLRCQLKPELYRRCVREYLQRYALQSVVTDDLQRVLDETTGRSWDRFFDQWVYHAGHPQVKVQYEWLAEEKLAKVTIQQTQKIDQDVMLFQFPTRLRFLVDGRPVDHELVVQQPQQVCYVPLPAQPTLVRFDPDYTVLAEVDFDLTEDMLLVQLRQADDIIGRLLATESLARRPSQRVVDALRQTLQQDAHYGVRRAASVALRKIHTDEALAALAASLEQADARVRLQVVEDLADCYRPQIPPILEQVLAREANPAIQAAAIRGLGRFQGDAPRARIKHYLQSQSFRNELAQAAIDAIRRQRDPRYRQVLQEVLQQREKAFTAHGFSEGLETLATISRERRNKSQVRSFLLGYLNHPREAICVGAARALGELGDPAAFASLETLAIQDGPPSRLSRAAAEALQRLQQQSPQAPEEITSLRQELTELKSQNAQLRKQFDELKARLEARPAAAKEPPSTPAPNP